MREANPVGSTTLQSFGGAIRRFRAHRGIFVTTSGFTSEARGVAEQDGNIDLIDGDQLVVLFAEACQTPTVA
jgi:restriction system protein